MEVLKVSSKSNPNSVAGAMAGVVRQSGAVEVQVVGAGALNQAVKAIAIARGYVAPSGVDLICVPAAQPSWQPVPPAQPSWQAAPRPTQIAYSAPVARQQLAPRTAPQFAPQKK